MLQALSKEKNQSTKVGQGGDGGDQGRAEERETVALLGNVFC